MLLRYFYWNKYSRLEAVSLENREAGFDLHPEAVEDQAPNYPDEFMNAFLSSIKVFGYLDKHVFHELARHLQTIRLSPGQILFDKDNPTNDFYTVVDGTVEIFVKKPGVSEGSDYDDFETDHYLLHEVQSGGSVSSLFTILDLFTQDLVLPTGLNSLIPSAANEKVDEKEKNEHDLKSTNESKTDNEVPHINTVETSKTEAKLVGKSDFKGGPKVKGIHAATAEHTILDEAKRGNSMPIPSLLISEASEKHSLDGLSVTETPEKGSPEASDSISKSPFSVFPRLWGRTTSATSSVNHSDTESVGSHHSKNKAQDSEPTRSIHPQLVARAKTSTSLAVNFISNIRLFLQQHFAN